MRGDTAAAGGRRGRRHRGDEAAECFAAADGLSHLPLEDHLWREAPEPDVPRGRIEKRPLRDETDDFAPGGRHSKRFGFHPDHVERPEERRLLDIHEVHRHLRLPVHFQAQPFHVAQAA